jgi:excinuclease ABC subunit A
MDGIKRLVRVDQKPIGRTPRSNLATYTGLFDQVRKLFAATPAAKKRRYDAGRFSFNVAKGRCEHCAGEGFVMVELLFLPSVYAPCPTCERRALQRRRRWKSPTRPQHRRRAGHDGRRGRTNSSPTRNPSRARCSVLREVGLGYLRLGQPRPNCPAARPSASSWRPNCSAPAAADTLYVLDEPTTGLHPLDVDRLMAQLERLVDAGNTVIMVEHTMRVVAACDWVIDIGPGAGDAGGTVVAAGPPADGGGAAKPHGAVSCGLPGKIANLGDSAGKYGAAHA